MLSDSLLDDLDSNLSFLPDFGRGGLAVRESVRRARSIDEAEASRWMPVLLVGVTIPRRGDMRDIVLSSISRERSSKFSSNRVREKRIRIGDRPPRLMKAK